MKDRQQMNDVEKFEHEFKKREELIRNINSERDKINWPNLVQQKDRMNEFWAELFKMTEPYMSKYQKEEVYNKIKRKVFEERSNDIKKMKNQGKQSNKEVSTGNNFMFSKINSKDKKLNAYNLDNNDLDYIVYK